MSTKQAQDQPMPPPPSPIPPINGYHHRDTNMMIQDLNDKFEKKFEKRFEQLIAMVQQKVPPEIGTIEIAAAASDNQSELSNTTPSLPKQKRPRQTEDVRNADHIKNSYHR